MRNREGLSSYKEEIRSFKVEKITVGDFSFDYPASDQREETGIAAVPITIKRACPQGEQKKMGHGYDKQSDIFRYFLFYGKTVKGRIEKNAYFQGQNLVNHFLTIINYIIIIRIVVICNEFEAL